MAAIKKHGQPSGTNNKSQIVVVKDVKEKAQVKVEASQLVYQLSTSSLFDSKGKPINVNDSKVCINGLNQSMHKIECKVDDKFILPAITSKEEGVESVHTLSIPVAGKGDFGLLSRNDFATFKEVASKVAFKIDFDNHLGQENPHKINLKDLGLKSLDDISDGVMFVKSEENFTKDLKDTLIGLAKSKFLEFGISNYFEKIQGYKTADKEITEDRAFVHKKFVLNKFSALLKLITNHIGSPDVHFKKEEISIRELKDVNIKSDGFLHFNNNSKKVSVKQESNDKAVWGKIAGKITNQKDLNSVLSTKLERKDVPIINSLDDIKEGDKVLQFTPDMKKKLDSIEEGAEKNNFKAKWNQITGAPNFLLQRDFRLNKLPEVDLSFEGKLVWDGKQVVTVKDEPVQWGDIHGSIKAQADLMDMVTDCIDSIDVQSKVNKALQSVNFTDVPNIKKKNIFSQSQNIESKSNALLSLDSGVGANTFKYSGIILKHNGVPQWQIVKDATEDANLSFIPCDDKGIPDDSLAFSISRKEGLILKTSKDLKTRDGSTIKKGTPVVDVLALLLSR